MPFPVFRSPIRVLDSSLDRLVLATLDDGPPPVPGGRPKGCKRLHTNAKVAHVRRLIEQTSLTYKQIEAKTGVSAGTVGRWKREFNWTRHPLAPRASDTVPTERAGRRLKLRMLSSKLQQLAERYVDELWQSPSVDLNRLIEAMEVLKMARLTQKGPAAPADPARRHAPKRTGWTASPRSAKPSPTCARAASSPPASPPKPWRCWTTPTPRRSAKWCGGDRGGGSRQLRSCLR
jgi:hypothetical protein